MKKITNYKGEVNGVMFSDRESLKKYIDSLVRNGEKITSFNEEYVTTYTNDDDSNSAPQPVENKTDVEQNEEPIRDFPHKDIYRDVYEYLFPNALLLGTADLKTYLSYGELLDVKNTLTTQLENRTVYFDRIKDDKRFNKDVATKAINKAIFDLHHEKNKVMQHYNTEGMQDCQSNYNDIAYLIAKIAKKYPPLKNVSGDNEDPKAYNDFKTKNIGLYANANTLLEKVSNIRDLAAANNNIFKQHESKCQVIRQIYSDIIGYLEAMKEIINK